MNRATGSSPRTRGFTPKALPHFGRRPWPSVKRCRRAVPHKVPHLLRAPTHEKLTREVRCLATHWARPARGLGERSLLFRGVQGVPAQGGCALTAVRCYGSRCGSARCRPRATVGEPAARLPSGVLWELFLVTYLHQFDFLCLSGRLWESWAWKSMISWQLMNFSQTESKVRFYCSPQTRRRKGQGLRGLCPAVPTPPSMPTKVPH